MSISPTDVVARTILAIIARRLQTVALEDLSLTSLTFVINLGAPRQVGRIRSVVMRAEVRDEEGEGLGLDACGPVNGRRG